MTVLLTGASGQLGAYLLRELSERCHDIIAWSGSGSGQLEGVPLRPVNLVNSDHVAGAFRESRASVVIHAAAMAGVADCYGAAERARRINTGGTAVLAELTARSAARLVYVSTDLVFDGERGGYRETDSPSPLSIYGRTKAEAEPAVLAAPRSVVVRVSLLFGPTRTGRPSFFDQQVAALRDGRRVNLFEDEWRTPIAMTTAASALVTVAESDYVGMLHLGGPERISRYDMGRRLATCLGADSSLLVPTLRASAPFAEPRPRDTSLNSSQWRELFPRQPWPDFESAIAGMSTRH